MDEKLLKRTALSCVALMLMVIMISIAISQYTQITIYADSVVKQGETADYQNIEGTNQNLKLEVGTQGKQDKLLSTDDSISQQLGDKYLIIKKSKQSYKEIHLQELYMQKSIIVTVSGLTSEVFDDTFIVRFNQGLEFNGMPVMELEETEPSTGTTDTTDTTNTVDTVDTVDKADTVDKPDKVDKADRTDTIDVTETAETAETEDSKDTSDSSDTKNTDKKATTPETGVDTEPAIISDPVKEFSIVYSSEVDSKLTATISITLDGIYVPILYEDQENIYIDLRRPKDVYDKIIVLDAGHGGKDSGTYSTGGKYYEKNINLDILLYLKEILDQEDIKVYYTRTTNQTVFLNPRVNLANDVEADLFLSIHCNGNESSEPDGFEVLYNELVQKSGFQSKQLAQLCLEEISKVTKKVNRGLVNGSEMLIINKAKMPVTIMEISFLSNADDVKFLTQEKNKKNIAKAINNVIVKAYNELEP